MPTQADLIEEAQQETLRRLRQVSHDIMEKGMELKRVGDKLIEAISDGLHLPGFYNQLMFDLRSDYTKREELIRSCHMLRISHAAITEASKG